MIRQVLTELGLFIAPFAAYAIFLWATRAGVLDPASWPFRTVAWLTVSAVVLVGASFVLLALFSGVPPRSTYVPAHIEDGQVVPGTTK
jgi:hypothetical protein